MGCNMTEKLENLEQLTAEKSLFCEFPIPTSQQWREVVDKTLKGAKFEEKLVTNTYEGIPLQPIYRKEDTENNPHLSSLPGEFPYVRGTKEGGYREKSWDVCQEIYYSALEEFNQAARNDLEKGQTMLYLALDEMKNSVDRLSMQKRSRVTISTLQDFQQAFQDINFEEIPICVEAGTTGFPFFASFMAFLQRQNVDTKKLKGCIGMDPLGQLALTGTLPYSINQAFEMTYEITEWSKEHAPQVQTIMVGGHPYHDAGGNAVQELAFAIATGVDYLRHVDNQLISLDDVAQRMRFSFSIGSNFFMEIAKFRAARLVWSRIVKELGGNDHSQKMTIHARTSSWTKTMNDPYVNILRGTVEALGGIIGGVDSLCVTPFDIAAGRADEFSQRIARNTQLILEKEANLGRVTDPAGGSWYIESLTFSLAEKVWELFQKVEEMGGMYRALKAGFPQETVARTTDEKLENIKRRKHRFVGVNIYPNLSEHSIGSRDSNEQIKDIHQSPTMESHSSLDQRNSLIDSLFTKEALQDFISNNSIENAIRAADSGASIDDLVDALNLSVSITPSVRPLRIHRGAEPFEDLRMHSELYKKRTGGLPKVFVGNIGVHSDNKHLSDFITDFFEVGGFHVIQQEGFHSINKTVREFRSSQARIVVICPNDDNDTESVSSLVRRIKMYNAEFLVLFAGNPSPEDKNIYMQAGVDDFIHSEVNHYEKLLEIQMKGGVRK